MSEVWRTHLPTTEKMILLVIADHASDEGDNAWPSQKTIADRASCSIRTVQRTVNELVRGGWLRMEKGAGGSVNCREDRRPHRYTINLGKVRGDTMTRRKEVRGDIDDIDEATLTPSTGRQSRPMNHSIETPIETPISFEDFWKVYPRKTAKGAAKKAWEKITEKEAAIAGAVRFAADPNRDETFTPHPATWLNAERWTDDPLPPRKRSLEEIKALELADARARAEREREASLRLLEADRAAREKAVPMPADLKELLRRV